jgi:hypothetical protein
MATKISFKAHLHKTKKDLTSNPAEFWKYMRNKGKDSGIPEEMHLGDINVLGPQIPATFASYFSSVYKTPNTKLNDLDTLNIDQYSFLPSNISLSLENVSEGLNTLSNSHSKGPDGIAATMLYQCREALCIPLLLLFNISLQLGCFPEIWKISRITPIYKAGDPTDIKNYRPISGLPLIGKLFELLVLKTIERKFIPIISKDQHGFISGQSTVTNMIDYSNYYLDAFELHQQVDVIFTDLSKAFDSVDHNTLIYNLDKLGVGDLQIFVYTFHSIYLTS